MLSPPDRPTVSQTFERRLPAPDLRVSVVVPVFRDEAALQRVLPEILRSRVSQGTARTAAVEIIIATTAADTGRLAALKAAYPELVWTESDRGRARQMNAGAARSTGQWLLFLHADTQLPGGWLSAIEEADRDPDIALGCFSFALDSTRRAARLIEAGVRWRVRFFGLPYGDQAIFVRTSVFRELGGYADIPIMEDVDLVRRARRLGGLYSSTLAATTSSRLWEERGWVGTTVRHLGLIMLYGLGLRPDALVRLARTRRL